MNYLTPDQLAEIRLPKWPSCDIQGRAVTPQQALDIRLRTCAIWFFHGDEELNAAVESAYYSAIPKPEWEPKWWLHRTGKSISRKRQYRKEMGNLDLQYLSNAVTCGSDVWCSWKGSISYHNYLAQCKEPTPLELLKEWEAVATAFPYLQLTCYVFTEDCAQDGEPTAVVYYVDNGKVEVSAISTKLRTEAETLEYWTQACQTVTPPPKNDS